MLMSLLSFVDSWSLEKLPSILSEDSCLWPSEQLKFGEGVPLPHIISEDSAWWTSLTIFSEEFGEGSVEFG